MSMNKQNFLMATPAMTREHIPRSCRNSRNPMSHTIRWEMRLYLPAFHAKQYRIKIKHVRSLDFLHRTTESPQEHCLKRR